MIYSAVVENVNNVRFAINNVRFALKVVNFKYLKLL